MTAKQITKKLTVLLSAGDMKHLEISRGEIECMVPDESNPGVADLDASHALMERVAAHLPWGASNTGYNAWILRESHQSLGDWNDRTSRHHY